MPDVGDAERSSVWLTQFVRLIVADPLPVTVKVAASVDHFWPVTSRVVVHRGFVAVAGIENHTALSSMSSPVVNVSAVVHFSTSAGVVVEPKQLVLLQVPVSGSSGPLLSQPERASNAPSERRRVMRLSFIFRTRSRGRWKLRR